MSNQLILRFILISIMATALLVTGGCASARVGGGMTTSPSAEAGPSIYTLDLGDAALKGQTANVREGEIIDAASGRNIAFDALIDTLAEADVIFLGESHTSMSIHRWQDRIVRALHARGESLKIGMEFFEREENDHLKRWVDGWLTEKGLLYLTGWYASGGYNFGYYRPFISFARDVNIPVFGINVPRMVVRTISRKGMDALSDEQKAMVGEVNLSNAEHRELIMFYFGGANMTHGSGGENEARMNRMYAAQRTWDTVFADSAIEAHKDWDGTVVIIVGSGHVSYNLGSNLILKGRSDLTAVTVMPVHVPEGGARQVRRSFGDVIIGVPQDTDPAHYPSFGVSATDKDGSVVVGMLFPGAVALKAGMKQGDVITALDGREISDATDMRIRLAAKGWGETATFTVKRGQEELTVQITPKKEK